MPEPASHAAKLATTSASVLTVEVEVPVIEPATHAVKLATQRRIVPAAEALVTAPVTDVVRLATTSATVLPLLLVVEAKRASTAARRGKL